MRVLITGAAGFAGSHLADYLLAQNYTEVWGVSIFTDRPAYLDPRVQLLVGDLCDPAQTEKMIAQVQPERIYHLAGQASPAHSWADAWGTFEGNIRAQLNIFQTLVKLKLTGARTLVIGSSDEYGRLTLAQLPAREASPLLADSPYGVSKIAQDFLGQSYYLSHQLPIVRVRPFNHLGPRQNPLFVAPNFAKQIVAIERGTSDPIIRVGNLKAERDFTDVRDTVRAYVAALEQGVAGEVYNVASGVVHSIQDLLDGLLAHAAQKIKIEIDPARLRPSDIPRMHGDASKLRALTGWQPTIPLTQTLQDLLNYEREIYK